MPVVPPGLTRESWDRTRSEVELHDHAIALFERDEDLLPQLERFIAGGIATSQLIVFVHSYRTDDEAWEFLARAREGDLRSANIVLVSTYREAFEAGHDIIDHAHVAAVVESLGATASKRGLQGVRIFVDASRQYFSAGRITEWFAFESWLGRQLHANVGLVCAYHTRDLARADIFERALHTHAYRFDAPR